MDTADNPGLADVAGLSSLDDPARRRLYEYVASHDEPVSREDAAEAAGISRTLAAYHMDKLADAGLLTTSYARPPGSGGPGAGRPAKRYMRAQGEITVSVPPRNYTLLAGLMTEAVSADTSGAVRAAVNAAARKTGRAAGRAARAQTGAEATADSCVMAGLRACGYEPATDADGDVELRNCPFHLLAQQHIELVCGLNLQLVAGLVEAAGASPRRAELAPRPDRCCVVVRGGGHRRGVLRRREPTARDE